MSNQRVCPISSGITIRDQSTNCRTRTSLPLYNHGFENKYGGTSEVRRERKTSDRFISYSSPVLSRSVIDDRIVEEDSTGKGTGTTPKPSRKVSTADLRCRKLLRSLSLGFHGEIVTARKPRILHRLSDAEIEDPIARKTRLRETLKRAMRIIKVVSLIASCMLRSSKDSTTETFVAQLHYITRTSEEKENLRFNKNTFQKGYSLRVPSWLPQIADTLPKDRTPEAIYKIYGVMNDMKSFERFTNKVRLELCRVARYMSCGKGRVIVRQGHVGFGFYFIYSGSVFVQLDIEDQTGVVMAQTVNIIGKGACFGELALLGDGRRTASIICREPTELFEIEKDTFLESCPYIYEGELTEKIDITQKYNFFRKWPKANLHRLCFESQIREVSYGKIVDRDTIATDYLYFVLKGKLVMLKELDLSKFMRSDSRSLRTCADRHLPPPRPRSSAGNTKTFPHATKHNKCYIKIGDIQDGESTEMTSVKQTDDGKHKPTGVILVSNGVRLMCVSKRKLQEYAPKQLLDDYSRNHEPASSIPTDEELYMKYLSDINWQTYKSNIVETLNDEKCGKSILSRPATAKGSSAWSRWPGNQSQTNSDTLIRSKTESHLSSHWQSR
ncbi:uncharacterized protein [Antedon mediterranea]|uniref:uncharacterized protein n=1 Tax=Antedon mediterranea TaxID=105859 RepID=UPI003AF90C07